MSDCGPTAAVDAVETTRWRARPARAQPTLQTAPRASIDGSLLTHAIVPSATKSGVTGLLPSPLSRALIQLNKLAQSEELLPLAIHQIV